MDHIAIILPFRNAERWLSDCLLSLQSQSHTNWSLVAINDNSTDNSSKLLEDFRAAHSGRVAVMNNEGQGLVDALNQATERIAGDFVSRMDADDVMPAYKLTALLRVCKSGGSGTLATGKVRYFSEGEVSAGYKRYENWLNERAEKGDFWSEVYRECPVAGANWMCAIHDFRQAGGVKNLELPDDYDFIFRCYGAGMQVKAIGQVTHLWREHGLRTSRIHQGFNQKAFFQMKLARFIALDYDTQKTLALWGWGQKARMAARILNARQIPFKWFIQPANWENTTRPKELLPFTELPQFKPLQLLSAVHPPSEIERNRMEEFWHSCNLERGSSWWYL